MPEQSTINLDANVVVALVQIIDLGGKKGAYTGNDLSVVGNIRSLLVEELKPFMDTEEATSEEE
jgi:hypothetical protein